MRPALNVESKWGFLGDVLSAGALQLQITAFDNDGDDDIDNEDVFFQRTFICVFKRVTE